MLIKVLHVCTHVRVHMHEYFKSFLFLVKIETLLKNAEVMSIIIKINKNTLKRKLYIINVIETAQISI